LTKLSKKDVTLEEVKLKKIKKFSTRVMYDYVL